MANKEEIAKLADYGYDTARTISSVVHLLLWTLVPITELSLYLYARTRIKDERIKSICERSKNTLSSFCKSSKLWLLAPVLAIAYAIVWWVWRQYLVERENISYDNYYGLVSTFYPIASFIWLKYLYRYWQKQNATEQSHDLDWVDKTENRNNMLLLQCAIGLYISKSVGPGILLFIYPFLAIRENLFLALVLNQKQSGLQACRTSINLAKGNFFKFARIFALPGAIASTTWIAHHHLSGIDITQYTNNSLLYLLFDTALDATESLIYICLDGLILLRGLEYLKGLTPEEIYTMNKVKTIIKEVE